MSTNHHIATGVGGSASASSVSPAKVKSNPEPGQTNTFILLHGFFFLEVQNDKLVIASPPIPGHDPSKRDHGGDLEQWDGTTIDDVKSLIGAGTAPQFPPELLHFSRQKAGVPNGQFFIDEAKKDQFAVFAKLPLPDAIVPLRKGTQGHYHPDRTKNVPQSIDNLCRKSDVALVVFLQYSSKLLFTQNYYIEHPDDPNDINDVNSMFQIAADVFGRPGFDFRITKLDKTKVFTGRDKNVPVGIDPDDDEEAIGEVKVKAGLPSANRPRAIAVATCPMFGIVQ